MMSAAEVRRASRTAGIALLLLAILSGFGQFAAVQHLVVENDAVKTTARIAGSKTLFRLGVAGLLVAAALDIVVAWALFRVFEPVSNSLSILAAWFRLEYAAIFIVAIPSSAESCASFPERAALVRTGCLRRCSRQSIPTRTSGARASSCSVSIWFCSAFSSAGLCTPQHSSVSCLSLRASGMRSAASASCCSLPGPTWPRTHSWARSC
jgi:hypothetical protein